MFKSLPFIMGTPNLELRIKVVTGSSRNEIAGAKADGTLKMRVAATQESGRVNDELCAYFAKLYGVRKSAVTIHSGKNSLLKVVRIAACPLEPATPRSKPGVGLDVGSLVPIQ